MNNIRCVGPVRFTGRTRLGQDLRTCVAAGRRFGWAGVQCHRPDPQQCQSTCPVVFCPPAQDLGDQNPMPRLPTHRQRATSAPARLIDVAARAGVSRATASKVLLGTGGPNTRVSDDTAQRVRSAAARLGYHPNRIAQQLKGARSGLLGLVIGFGSSAVLNDRVIQFERIACERGYRLFPGHAHGDSQRAAEYIQDLLSRGIEALIAVHFGPHHLDHLLQTQPACPVVFQCQVPVPGHPYVLLDRAAGIAAAVHHLAQRGRERIGILSHDAGPAVEPRLQGYCRAHAQLGRKVDRRLQWLNVAPYPQQTNYNRVIDELILDAGADAVLANNDLAGVLLLKALRRRGLRVPEDVAVVGFDNLDVAAAAEPELTSIDQCNIEVASRTIDYALQLAQGADPAALPPVLVQPELVVRASSGG